MFTSLRGDSILFTCTFPLIALLPQYLWFLAWTLLIWSNFFCARKRKISKKKKWLWRANEAAKGSSLFLFSLLQKQASPLCKSDAGRMPPSISSTIPTIPTIPSILPSFVAVLQSTVGRCCQFTSNPKLPPLPALDVWAQQQWCWNFHGLAIVYVEISCESRDASHGEQLAESSIETRAQQTTMCKALCVSEAMIRLKVNERPENTMLFRIVHFPRKTLHGFGAKEKMLWYRLMRVWILTLHFLAWMDRLGAKFGGDKTLSQMFWNERVGGTVSAMWKEEIQWPFDASQHVFTVNLK